MAKLLTIQLESEGDRLTVKSMIDALERALGVLRTLDPNEEWEVVRVTKNSPLKIYVRSPSVDTVAPKYMSGLRQMGLKRHASLAAPPGFGDSVLTATRHLADVLDEGFKGIKISFPGERTVAFTPQVVARVGAVSRGSAQWHYEWTAIRGLLYQITWSENSTRCRIRDAVSGTEVPCVAAPGQLDKVKDALPHRVDAYGRAKMNRLGAVLSMDIERLRVLPDRSRPMAETPAIDITAGLSAVAHVERLRGGD